MSALREGIHIFRIGRPFVNTSRLSAVRDFTSFRSRCLTGSSCRFYTRNQSSFGILFDIDGVLLRGHTPIPGAKEAMRKLVDRNGEFQVPVVFVTNAGNSMRQSKAELLSKVLDVQVSKHQVIMSHSPLQMFTQYHQKRVLVSGQGPMTEIAENLGFQHVVTIDMLREAYPLLDVVDHNRRPKDMLPPAKYVPPVEAIVLFGEPIRWETNLQLILDLLLSNGNPALPLTSPPYPHIPVLACNMDLMWMAEAKTPRFGHGTFLVCLENIYKKITGKELKYAALIGKPSIITYNYAELLVQQQAERRGWSSPFQRLYAIGDNPMADIYGANLYNRYLQSIRESMNQVKKKKVPVLEAVDGEEHENVLTNSRLDELTHGGLMESCSSILVCTGVYHRDEDLPTNPHESVTERVFHGHRDFHFDPSLVEAAFIVQDVNDAVDLVFSQENWDPNF